LLADPAALVRGAAVWALGRLADRETFERHRHDLAALETDETVVAEWNSGARAWGLRLEAAPA
jgi:epoxyqueuosine reductase